MPLGEVIAELIGSFVGHVLWEGLVIKVLWPIVRYPGAVLGWSIWRGRPFRKVWSEGDHFEQTMAGLFIWTAIALIVAVVWSASPFGPIFASDTP